MASLILTESHNFRGEMLTSVNTLEFAGAGYMYAIFDGAQFGGGYVSNSLAVDGNGQSREIDVHLAPGSGFSAAGWTFTDWNASNTINYVGTSGAETITGTSQLDYFSGGGGADTLDGGAGTDFFRYQMPSEVGAGSTLKGGDGIDTIYMGNVAGTYDFSTSTISDVEILRFYGSGVSARLTGDQIGAGKIDHVTIDEGTAQKLVVAGNFVDLSGVSFEGWDGGSRAVRINGTGAVDKLVGSSQADVINGGGGNDSLFGGDGADQLNGGAGTDTVGYSGSATGVVASLANPAINTGAAAGDTYSSIENISGSKYNDSIYGNNGANVVNGGAGNDLIKGYGGNDTLTGGSGGDAFIFNTALNAASNVDHITDFNVAADTIWIDDAVFANAGAAGTLSAAAFYVGTAAHDASDRIVYDSVTGHLSYDADGNGAGLAVQFATVATGLSLTNADFLII
jgi:serralysin